MHRLLAEAPKVRHDLYAGPWGLGPSRHFDSPPSRTGLLTLGPSDLNHLGSELNQQFESLENLDKLVSNNYDSLLHQSNHTVK